jgi:hypothetical protein
MVHLIVQQHLPRYLAKYDTPPAPAYAKLLTQEPCSPYAAFGSMGGDFLFFSVREYGDGISDFANFIFRVYDALEPLIDFYEQYIKPVKDAIEDALAALDQALFQGLFAQIGQTGKLLSTTALEAAAVVLTKKVDLFYPFYPKVQQGKLEDEWYWIDMLHDRRPGQFCSKMWSLAQGDDDLMRYCLGYASHIGTDVVGHPFVNAIVGGPYRTHWHRHKLIENWIDAYARNHYGDLPGTKQCLALGGDDQYVPNAISGSYYYRLVEFPGEKLPPKLGGLLKDALQTTYASTAHPVWLDHDDMDTAYRLWLMWFRRSTTIGSAVKPTPVPPPGAAAGSLVTDYVSGLPSYSGGGGGGGSGSFWDILAALAALVKWLIDAFVYTVEWIVTHTVNILLLPLTEALALVKWLLYQLQKTIYLIYDNLRWALVLGGYLFPEPGDLAKLPYGQAFLNTAHVHLLGWTPANFSMYPRKQEAHGLLGPTEHHLPYPGTLQELPHAEPAPLPFHGQYPEAFISKGYSYDPAIEKLYDCVGPYGAGSKYTHSVDQATWATGQFGSAMAFCTRLIAQRMASLPNLNLDADRGYGWKTWRAQDPAHIETGNPVPVDYVDA